MTPEGVLVAYLVKQAKAEGFRIRKLSYEGRRGAPDRLILAPGASLFVEVKAPGEKPRPEQLREIDLLLRSGLAATWVSSKDEIDKELNRLSLRSWEALDKGFYV